MPDENSAKTVITESVTSVKRAEGENASLSFAGSKHMTKWLMAAVAGLFINAGHSILLDFTPPKGAAAIEQVKVTAAQAVGRNDEDNKQIKEKLDGILVMKNDMDKMKEDMRDLKVNVNDLNRRIDEVMLNSKH